MTLMFIPIITVIDFKDKIYNFQSFIKFKQTNIQNKTRTTCSVPRDLGIFHFRFNKHLTEEQKQKIYY